MKLAVVKGDGIGREVITEAIKVLDAFNLDIEKIPLEIGYSKWEKTGFGITEEDIDILKTSDYILFGAITTPKNKNYKSVLLTIRKELDLYANVRPIKPIEGIKGIGKDNFDFVIVRENTEGMYSGIEESDEFGAYTKRVVTYECSKRIAEYACELAKKRNDKVTIVHKSNILKSDKLFLKVSSDIAKLNGVEYDDALVDSFAYHMMAFPEKQGVVVTTNLFGDILSDSAAALVGGLGIVPSANIGKKYAFFEPIHGSAPDIAGKNIANPIAAILSVKMLLEHIGLIEEANIVYEGVCHAIEKKIITTDLQGSATTSAVGDAVANYCRASLKC
ncbi:MAG: NAD-dependent isocitrate dehydrogenase [Methanosarcinales archaeon]|jgi:methanogen homoisocitrate dehydrogenase|nr:NAD-dependent isocitrate dehydrogenase [Methanosarcinales archaeon]